MQSTVMDMSQEAWKIVGHLQQSQPERQVDCSIAPGMRALGDAELLHTLLYNLLDNAWKFTSKHATARIEFGSTEQHNTPVYFVRDDGAGFDMAFADKLFGAFSRLHHTSEFPGTGIGLATVQRIVHRHGGSIWAEGAVEKGATFYFTLGTPRETTKER
jgi:light-regulated signal transduction histidine kinase (bacteriophytochrome)